MAYHSVSAARADIADYINWYNTQRPHSSLERLTPDEKYFDNERGHFYSTCEFRVFHNISPT